MAAAATAGAAVTVVTGMELTWPGPSDAVCAMRHQPPALLRAELLVVLRQRIGNRPLVTRVAVLSTAATAALHRQPPTARKQT